MKVQTNKVLVEEVDMDILRHKGEEERVVEFSLGHKGEEEEVE